jgi:hypothetical protein
VTVVRSCIDFSFFYLKKLGFKPLGKMGDTGLG